MGLPNRFAADRTVGKLAHHLRMLGFDTLFEPQVPADYFMICVKNGLRILLTRRNAAAFFHAKHAYRVESDIPEEQIRTLLRAFRIRRGDIRPFTRCLRCNRVIRPIDANDVRGRVPDFVFATQCCFFECDGCGRIYWRGTHPQKAIQRIESWFDVSAVPLD